MAQVAAERFIEDLVRQMFTIAELGLTGAPRDWIRLGLRAFPYQQRCVSFRLGKDRMVIVRVLHGNQDTDRQEF
jgi:toxin ParE1/3/4